MRHARNAVMSVVALVLAVVLSFGWATSTPEPAKAEGSGCIIQIEGSIGLVICGGELVEQLQLPTVKVTETVVDQIIKEIRVPGPTIRIPGPTETVTETTTITASPTGQAVPEDGSVTPDAEEGPAIDFGDGDTTIEEVGLGLLSIIALVGLLLLALYGGYVLGWKDKEKRDTDFMGALLDQAKLRRGEHS